MLIKLSDIYEQHFGYAYQVSWARETKAIKPLLSVQEPQRIANVWTKFIALHDDWYDGKKDISIFCADFNRICQRVESTLPLVNLDELKDSARNALNNHQKKLKDLHGQIIASKQGR